ncbi:hypothetical protein OIU84_018925 [Salix udensis]|uniref:TOD1/MUCI70 glycosyltransferase-like domain-containing protein n=1 Tax=Salix udensis TaxID=889485 RepID=A0AAD6KXN1_9ROSI|nr:hypothetical protein OIU84_018925 [Salix udensis]
MAYMSTCRVAVSSCILGSSDFLRRPTSKRISDFSKKNVCFVMFVDEQTLSKLASDGHVLDNRGFVGLWRVVVVRNLPSKDMQRTGKVPNFLSHRIFPSSRFDGLNKFYPSDPNTPLPSYVPEGSFIVQAHTPMSNLFSCWFNEVDQFTSRGQLSFAYTYLKLRRLNANKPFYLNMVKGHNISQRSCYSLFAEDVSRSKFHENA